LNKPYRTEKSKKVFEGGVFSVRVDDVTMPDGSRAEREVVNHSGGVVILAILEGKVIMVRQYRHPAGAELLELPAGKLEPREDPKECAVRELEEETGYLASMVTKLGSFYASPGYSSEMLHLYLASGLEATAQRLDDGEHLEVVYVPYEEALGDCLNGKIQDAKTALALLIYKKLYGYSRGRPSV